MSECMLKTLACRGCVSALLKYLLRWHVCRVNFARKIFFELRIFSRKVLQNLPRNFRAFILWVRRNPTKFPPNFPPNFPAKTKNHRRAQKYLRNIFTIIFLGIGRLGDIYHNFGGHKKQTASARGNSSAQNCRIDSGSHERTLCE